MSTRDKDARYVETANEAEELLADARLRSSLGASLIFRISEEILLTHRERFRSAFPEATLRPIPPPRPYTLDRPKAYRRVGTELHGIPDFRALPACMALPERRSAGGGGATSFAGSGIRASEHPLAKTWFSRCMHCASSDTRVIYASSAVHYGRVDTNVWDECEYECMECGWFTYHQVNEEY